MHDKKYIFNLKVQTFQFETFELVYKYSQDIFRKIISCKELRYSALVMDIS